MYLFTKENDNFQFSFPKKPRPYYNVENYHLDC
jgi:hypothetical protein